MKCPNCGNEAICNDTKIRTVMRTFDVTEIGSEWPVKIMCQRETSYLCGGCQTLITTSETRYYLPS